MPKYKIKINQGQRTLGPLDMERIAALAQKGVFRPSDPTSVEPFLEWRRFDSFIELTALLPQRKIALEDPAAQPTATMVHGASSLERGIEKNNTDSGDEMPTLLDIKAPPIVKPVDTEKTQLHIMKALAPDPQLRPEEATKILQTEELNKVLQKADINPASAAAAKKNFRIPKSILSQRTAIILAVGLVLIGFLSQTEDPGSVEDFNLTPVTVPFPYISAFVPSTSGKISDPRVSLDLSERGVPHLDRGTPLATIHAAQKFFIPAIKKNDRNIIARSLLASAYIRLSEVIPRDQYLFEALKSLLATTARPDSLPPEYSVAKAEFYALLLRYDQALEVVDSHLKRQATAELLFQKGRIHSLRNETDAALAAVNRAIKASPPGKINPRYRLLLAELLLLKKSEAYVQEAKLLLNESPDFGPGLLFNARLAVQENKFTTALKILSKLVAKPLMLTRPELAEAFLLTAQSLDGLKQTRKAVAFADFARMILPDKERAETLLFRIRSNLPESAAAYKKILSGLRFEKEKMYEKAENEYVLARETDPRISGPLLVWGRLLVKKGEPIQAIDRFTKALAINPQSSDSALELAELFVKRYEFESARSKLDRAAALKKNLDQVDYWRGIIFERISKQKNAESTYRSALNRGSRFAPLYIAMGDMEGARKNRELAEYYYAMALRYDPINPKALLGAALARFHLESPSRAITFLKDKLNAQPNSAPIMTNLAVIYRYSGDKDSTKSYLQNALRSDPTYAEAFRQIGDLAREEAESFSENVAAKENNYRFALASYEGYSKLAPFDPEGYMSTAELYFYVRDYGAAAKNYYKVLDLAPNYPGVRLRLARISLNGKDPARALALVQEELTRYPDSSDAHIELGKIQLAQALGFVKGGDRQRAELKFNEAATSLNTASSLSDSNASAIFFLGYVNLERGNYDSAQTLLERAKKLEPLSPDVHLQLGRVYLRKRNTAKAIEAFTNAKGLTQDPEKLGEIDGAMRGQ